MYAIIATGGKQYKVSEGDFIKIEKIEAEEGSTIDFAEVLAVFGDNTKLGNPVVKGASVSATIMEQGRSRKVIVYKYKRKSGYHKKNGHRQAYTKVRIDSIKA